MTTIAKLFALAMVVLLTMPQACQMLRAAVGMAAV